MSKGLADLQSTLSTYGSSQDALDNYIQNYDTEFFDNWRQKALEKSEPLRTAGEVAQSVGEAYLGGKVLMNTAGKIKAKYFPKTEEPEEGGGNTAAEEGADEDPFEGITDDDLASLFGDTTTATTSATDTASAAASAAADTASAAANTASAAVADASGQLSNFVSGASSRLSSMARANMAGLRASNAAQAQVMDEDPEDLSGTIADFGDTGTGLATQASTSASNAATGASTAIQNATTTATNTANDAATAIQGAATDASTAVTDATSAVTSTIGETASAIGSAALDAAAVGAEALGPIGILAAAGIGIYELVHQQKQPSSAPAPITAASRGGMVLPSYDSVVDTPASSDAF